MHNVLLKSWFMGLMAIILSCAIAPHSLAEKGDHSTTDIHDEGIELSILKRSESTYQIIKIDLRKVDLTLHRSNSDNVLYKNFKDLEKDLQTLNKSLLFATNAGIFHKDYFPNGLYIESSKTISPLNTKNGKGNFYLKPNGVFMIQAGIPQIMNTSHYKKSKASPEFALQSGPLLMDKGVIHPAFNKGSNNKFTRSGIGIQNDHTVIIALSNTPVNLYAFADLFKTSLHCQNALYLDGFISQFYIPTKSEGINLRPYGSYIAVCAK